jgi:hypothetical protein
MPVTTRSSMRPSATAAVVSHSYSLRTTRPEAGYYAEVDEEMDAAAATLLSMRNAESAQPTRRSARLASRS